MSKRKFNENPDTKLDFTKENAYGYTLLTNAITDNNLEKVKFFLKEGANIEEPDRCEQTAIQTAIIHDDIDCENTTVIVEFLLTLNPNLCHQDVDGDTVLHMALLKDHTDSAVEIFQMLVKAGAPINMKNHKGETPIDLISDHLKCSDLLKIIELDSSPNNFVKDDNIINSSESEELVFQIVEQVQVGFSRSPYVSGDANVWEENSDFYTMSHLK